MPPVQPTNEMGAQEMPQPTYPLLSSDHERQRLIKQADKADHFNWIQIHPLLTAEAIKQFPFDHAGEGETSLMLDLCPEGVDMRRFSAKEWFTRSAKQASAETGKRGRQLILAHMRAVMRLDAPRRKAAALRKKPTVRKKPSVRKKRRT